MQAIRVLDAPRCHLGEGPCYEPSTETAWWVDILERRLFECGLADGPVRVHALPFMASLIAATDGEGHLVAADDGLYLRHSDGGGLTLHCRLENDDPGTRSNDGRVHPSGALWISTMSCTAEAGRGAIYHVAGERVTRLYGGLTIPNAISFSPDGREGYFVDSDENRLRRVSLDPATGLPNGDPADLYHHHGEGDLDGAAVDADGLIWIARWGASCLDAYSPEGERVRSVSVPASRPSCPTFAGPNLDQLLVTSAYEGMDADERAADPEHGRTFLVPVGVKGLLEPRFRLGG